MVEDSEELVDWWGGVSGEGMSWGDILRRICCGFKVMVD